MPGFGEILGHDQIKEHFRRAIETEKVSHAYILSGESGMGKKTRHLFSFPIRRSIP